VIEEHKGKRLPTREKLADICKLYSQNAEVYEGKDDVKVLISKLLFDQAIFVQTLIEMDNFVV
jgi:hypothetical protein